MADSCRDNISSFSLLGLREVIPDQTGVEQWKELMLNTGGTHLTLQDIKLPEGSTAGGYCYKDSSNVLTRNRFIYWQTSNDVLELVEQSLDLNLHGNYLRIRFQGLPILEGTSIHETQKHIIILVTTISSVHRLVLSHPLKQNDSSMVDIGTVTVPSIFTEASLPWLRDSISHQVINSTAASVTLPYTASSCLIDGSANEALFALANSSSITLIRLGNPGAISTSVLQPSSFASRLLSGFIPSVLKSTTQDEDATSSVTLQSFANDTLVFTLSKGGRLRVWSASTQECRLDFDLIEHLGGKALKQQGCLGHRIRCCSTAEETTTEDSYLKLTIFSSFAKQKSFLVLNLQIAKSGAGPVAVAGHPVTITAQPSRLIDFSLTLSHLYALWNTTQGEFLLQFVPVPAGDQNLQLQPDWQTVTLEPGIDTEVEYDETVTDPKQAYLKAIFKPGLFSVSTLAKALQAFQRSTNEGSARRNVNNLQLGALKEEIISAIEIELNDQVSDMDITEEDYIQIWHKCWAQFYAYVVQYHRKRPVPVGLLIDETTGFHCLIKKGMISFLRPLDLVESLVLQRGRNWEEAPYKNVSHFFDQQPLSSGLVALLQFLSMVDDKLDSEQVNRFDRLMFQLQSADQIAKEIANELLQSDPLNLLNLMNATVSSSSICHSLSTLLQQLGVDMSNTKGDQDTISPDIIAKAQYKLLFNGTLGLSAIAESARQMADLRLALCRDVLIVQQLLILSSENLPLSPVDAAAIGSVILPRTVPLTHAYYALSWICQYPAQTVSNALLEQNVRQMAILGFKKSQESHGWAAASSVCKNLVELFLLLDGGQATRQIVLQEEDMPSWTSPWLDAFPNFVKAVGQLLWPIGNHVTFMEFLMERFQPLAVQGYVRLLQNWCEWNTCSRKFLKAVALVATGEGDKASRWILEAAEGIAKEELLLSIILRNTTDDPQSNLTMRYYLICVQLLEQAGLSTAALRVALVALKNGRKDDPLLPTLWSIVAKLHLHLGHYQEAYEAIVSNPDSSQRPESLGRLVNTLLERKQMDILLTFPYVGLESELEKIIERRARASDVFSMTVYYSFLYAFHVRQGKMRKAAAVMYEQAIRHGCENEASKQVKCLLACLNALRLVSRDEAWLVKPVQDSANRLTNIITAERTVEVIEYSDIEKEYEMSYACLNLGHSIVQLTPPEVITLLTSKNHYESALRIARIFDIKDTSSVMEHLAGNCVALSRDCINEEEAWVWLAENHAIGVGKASEQAWRLLERLLPKAEDGAKQTRCHRAAARKILSLDCSLPYWLSASYKLRNPGELITVYHQAGLLEEAAQVALELLDAVLGQGKKCYGYATPLHADSPSVWLPYSSFDRLVLELEANQEDPTFVELLEDLQEKLKAYFELAERVSTTVVRSAMA